MSDSTCPDDKLSRHGAALAQQRHLELLFNTRVEPFNFEMLALVSAGCSSFRITRGELGFKVNVLGDVSDAGFFDRLQQELLVATEVLTTASQHLARLTIVERLIIQLRKITKSVVKSRLPLSMVKSLLRHLAYLQCVLMGGISDAQTYHCARQQALSYFLQEPQSLIISLLRQHQYFLYWNYARRLRHLRRSAPDIPQSNDFIWPARHSYSEMNRQCNESRVLVTIHMGDFFGAFRCIAEALHELRPVISLRREGDADAIKSISHRHADGHQVFMHGKDNPLKIVKALRAGGQTLSVLFDLSGDFGETTDVTFFGHRARFVRGPAELAIVGKARIYPFVSFSNAGRDYIHMEPAFSPDPRPDETLQCAVGRVTQMLVTMAERWIRQHPAQWKYLDRLPSYLIPDTEVVNPHA